MSDISPSWTDITVAIVAVASLALSVMNLALYKRTIRLSEEQERRRVPSLDLYLSDCFVQRESTKRVYVFDIAITNSSDLDNSILAIELHVTYVAEKDARLTVKLAANRPIEAASPVALILPVRVLAHSMQSGRVTFALEGSIAGAATIQDYMLVLTDAHRITKSVSPKVIVERGA